MADNKSEKKAGFFQSVKGEFSKIVWPKRDQLIRETIAVSLVTLGLGLVIKLVDMVMQSGIAILVK